MMPENINDFNWAIAQLNNYCYVDKENAILNFNIVKIGDNNSYIDCNFQMSFTVEDSGLDLNSIASASNVMIELSNGNLVNVEVLL
jgi:hypothetical protein